MKINKKYNNDLGGFKFVWTDWFTIPTNVEANKQYSIVTCGGSFPDGCNSKNSYPLLFQYNPTNDASSGHIYILSYLYGYFSLSGQFCLTRTDYMKGAKARMLLLVEK